MASESYIYFFKKFLYDIWWSFKITAWLFIPKTKGSAIDNTEFSIGVVTYVDRYKKFFKPLITNLIALFPDTQITIAINGYHDPLIQNEYLQEMHVFLKGFKNITLIDFHGPQSLSKLWNLLVINSVPDKVLILNDDIKIGPAFRNYLMASPALNEEVALLNRSWSHFLISKSAIKKTGWFDQRFPGVGNEDEDYECRLALTGILVKSYKIIGLKNVTFKTINFSYGADTEVVNTKYVKANKVFFDQKWELSQEEKEGYVYVEIMKAYVKLKPGMETPVFYPLDILPGGIFPLHSLKQ